MNADTNNAGTSQSGAEDTKFGGLDVSSVRNWIDEFANSKIAVGSRHTSRGGSKASLYRQRASYLSRRL